jgi:CHAT domain-containing protein
VTYTLRERKRIQKATDKVKETKMKAQISAMVFLLCVFCIENIAAAAQRERANRPQAREETKTQQRNRSGDREVESGPVKRGLSEAQAAAVEAEKAGRWYDAAAAYVQASNQANRRGDLQSAFALATKAVEMAQKTTNALLTTRALSSLADAYRALGQPSKELEWLEKALVPAKQIASQTRSGTTWASQLYSRLGEIFIQQGDLNRAIEYTSGSLQSLESQLARTRVQANRLRAFNQVGEGYSRLGDVYLKAGKTEQAIATFENGLARIKESRSDNLGSETNLIIGLGTAYLQQKELVRALPILTKGLQMAEARRQSAQIQSASGALGDVLLQSDRASEAIPYYQKAVNRIESARRLLQSEEFRLSFFEDKGSVYGGMILANLETKQIDEAFKYNERARSRAFLDRLGTKIQLGRQSGLAAEERNLQARIGELKRREPVEDEADDSDGPDDSVKNAQNLQLDAAEKAYDEFVSKVRKENKEQASLMNVEPLTLKQFQQLLDPGTTVLEYFVVRGRAVLWIVEKDKAEVVRLASDREELVSKVTAYREAITELAEKEKFAALAQYLYKILIQPALPYIKGKELLIIPHDVLHYLPFQALLAPNGKYLIEDYPINYLSSASLMQFTQEKRKAKGELTKILAEGGKVLTFGNPDLDDPAMALQFAGIEAKEIKSLYPQSTIYLEKEATEERAKALVGNSDIIHFASHAELNEDDPLASAIRLAKSDKEDGRLEVREIFGMDLKASLVVLSACETGLGKLSSGDELVGLTRAFIYAGTPSVVASLWNVEDSSTAQLMASFYKNLKTMTKVEALRQAQLNLIRGNINSDLLARRGIGGVGKLGEVPAAKPASDAHSNSPLVSVSTSHPFFWAPFILVGEGK